MKNYWIKIALGAFGVFGVGMAIVYAIRAVRNKLNSVDPISFPVAFIPFKLDGQKLGQVDRLVLIRNEPQHIAGVRVMVQLSDPSDLGQLEGCLVAVDDVEHLDERSTFRCERGDTAGQNLEHFGYLTVRGQSDSFPLLLLEPAVREFRSASFDSHGIHGEPSGWEAVRRDSLLRMTHELGDSMQRMGRLMADSIRTEVQARMKRPR